MNKKLLLLFFIILLASPVLADKITVLKVHYKDGKLNLVDKVEKYGYYPDRKIQPTEGYRAEVISFDGDVLYSFMFEVPLEVYADVSDGDGISGGLFILDETDFAVIVPSYEEAKQIMFYDKNDAAVLSVDLEEKKILTATNLVIACIIILIILIIIFVRRKQKVL